MSRCAKIKTGQIGRLQWRHIGTHANGTLGLEILPVGNLKVQDSGLKAGRIKDFKVESRKGVRMYHDEFVNVQRQVGFPVYAGTSLASRMGGAINPLTATGASHPLDSDIKPASSRRQKEGGK